MTKSKTTRRALLSSCVALMLCFSMLLGTTYAWFTDTASTSVNMIQAGTLKVDLVSGEKSVKDGTLPSLDFTDKNGNTKILWEPGVTFKTPEFQIVNKGNLHLKYQLVINGITGGNAKLLEAIDFTIGNEDIKAGAMYGQLAPNEATDTMVITGHMDENAGNEYQGLSIDGITVTVYATQVEAEFDSFNNTYDSEANWSIGKYDFSDASDLLAFAPTAGDAASSGLRVQDGVAVIEKSGAWHTVNADLSDKNYTVEYDLDITDLADDEAVTVDTGEATSWGSTPIMLERGSTNVYYGLAKNETIGSLDGTAVHVTHMYSMNDEGKLEITTAVSDDETSVTYTKAVDSSEQITLYWDIYTVTESGKATLDNFAVSAEPVSKEAAELKAELKAAVEAGETNIVVDAASANIGNLNYGLTKTLVPEGTTVTIKNAVVEGKSYGNAVDGTLIFKNCIFTNTGAYSIHFDNGTGDVIFEDCTLYGWNSFGSTLNSVTFYDCSLYGNGTYALIRSYVDLELVNCHIDTTNANHDDVYNEGVEAVNGATLTMTDCSEVVLSPEALDKVFVADTETEGEAYYELTGDVELVDMPLYSSTTATDKVTIDGNGKTVTGEVSSVDAFQWEGGTIPAMSTIFSSENGEKVTVNDITFTGTMSAVMAGNYVDTNSDWFNTEFNNVNIVDAEVVSFSAGISPALAVYGKLEMNNCNIYGTTLSELDTDPMWPVYDMAIVNGSSTTVNGGKIGTIISWAKSKLILNKVEVESITPIGNMNTNAAYGIVIGAGTTVDVIDLSNITNKVKVNITIEDGATVGKIIANGVEYATITDWQNA